VTTVEGSGLLAEIADPRDLLGLLRAGHERPRRYAAQQRDDIVSPHVLPQDQDQASPRLMVTR